MDMKLFEPDKHDGYRAETGTKFIYLLRYKGESVYVGQTIELYNRAIWHKGAYRSKEFDEVLFHECPADQANNYEAMAIVKYNPPMNGNLPGNDYYVSSTRLFDNLHRFIRDHKDLFNIAYLAPRDGQESIPYITTIQLLAIENAIVEILEKK